MKNIRYNLVIVLLTLIFTSCEKTEFNGSNPGQYDKGTFVLNEGAFGSGNASVSFINANGDSILNNIFSTENHRPLGDVLQSMYKDGNYAYLVVNGSNKVEVVNLSDFKEVNTIVDLDGPRYMTVARGKGYITQWGGDGSVAVVDLGTMQVSNTIKTGNGPEGIMQVGDLLWVANGGGLGLDSTISMINPVNDEIVNTINVGYNPKEMVRDIHGNVWVICFGYVEYNQDWTIAKEYPSQLTQVSATNFSILKKIVIGQSLHPQHLTINPTGNKLYVGGGFGFTGLYQLGTETNTFPDTPLIQGNFYGFDVNPVTGEIYACVAPDFTVPGTVEIYSKQGDKIRTFTVGIGPSSVVF